MMLDEKINQLEGMLDLWSMFAKEYDDADVLKKMGTITVDGDEIQITNSMMESIAELIRIHRKQKSWENKRIDDLQHELKQERRERDSAREYAAMSDARIGDALDKEIEWFDANSGQEDLVWGPVELMGYCRDRLRSRT